MPFLRAGFNAKHRRTGIFGWTRHVCGTKFEPAQLIQFTPRPGAVVTGDYAWHGKRVRSGEEFLAWGEQVVLGTWSTFKLAPEHQEGLPQSKIPDVPPRLEPVRLVIYGEPASKANSRQLVSFPNGKGGKRPALIKSAKAREYENDALRQIPPAARVRFDFPVKVTMRVFYATERPDLDESVILDVLQDRFEKGPDGERVLVQKGVYRNDRQVREKHVYWGKDAKSPRAEIEVEPLVAQGDMLSEAAA